MAKKVDLKDLKNDLDNTRKPSAPATNTDDITVSFISSKGHIFTAEMNLPMNLTIDTMEGIGQTVLQCIEPKRGQVSKDSFVVLVQLKDENITLDQVEKIVIFDINKLNSALR